MSGGVCECECGLRFGGVVAFDAHRIGNYTLGTRRCLPPEELMARGLYLDDRGIWRRPGPRQKPIPADGVDESAMFVGHPDKDTGAPRESAS